MKTGVLLINIGTPASPEVKAVRKFLSRFLFDKRVIALPVIPRYILVKGIIALFRSPKSAKEYQKMWTEKGSPLKFITESLQNKIQIKLGVGFSVHYAMRYSHPDIENVLKAMQQENIKDIIIIPLYPQNASSTTGSSIEEVFKHLGKWNEIPGIRIVPPFFNHTAFIAAIVKSIQNYRISDYDAILFSYHGLPESHLKDSHKYECDVRQCSCEFKPENYHCYKAQCIETSRLLVEALNLPKEKSFTAFQSRLSKNWIGPFTDEVIYDLAQKGHKKIMVLCPAFTTDCLETLVEIGQELKSNFLLNGGEVFDLVPCLNDSDFWVDALTEIITEK